MITWIICGLLASVFIYVDLYINNKYGSSYISRGDAAVIILTMFLMGGIGLVFSAIFLLSSIFELDTKIKDWFNKKV